MARDKKRPGERRRAKKRRRVKKGGADFRRPIDWAQSELNGVADWLKRLKGPDGDQFPEGWRKGQIRHYERRARMLRREIKESTMALNKAQDEGGNGSTAA